MGKDLDELTSYMKPLAEELITKAREAGIELVVVDTGRTLDEQYEKLHLGLSSTTNSKHLPQSPEFKSEAIDVAPKVCLSMKHWGWFGKITTSHEYWGKIIEIGEDLGLHSGVHFPISDPGHFQYVHR